MAPRFRCVREIPRLDLIRETRVREVVLAVRETTARARVASERCGIVEELPARARGIGNVLRHDEASGSGIGRLTLTVEDRKRCALLVVAESAEGRVVPVAETVSLIPDAPPVGCPRRLRRESARCRVGASRFRPT